MNETVNETMNGMMNRVPDTGVAQGLRQHSIGETFPVIVQGRGVSPTTWEVMLGGLICPRMSLSDAHELARMVAKEYRQHGRKAAERLLVSYSIKALVNS